MAPEILPESNATCWLPSVVRWLLQVLLPAWISLIPKLVVLAGHDRLSWETALRGSDLITLAMTISLTSVIGLLGASVNLSFSELRTWRVLSAFFFGFLFLLAWPFRYNHQVIQIGDIQSFQAFRAAEKAEATGALLLGLAVVATLVVAALEIRERYVSGSGRRKAGYRG